MIVLNKLCFYFAYSNKIETEKETKGLFGNRKAYNYTGDFTK